MTFSDEQPIKLNLVEESVAEGIKVVAGFREISDPSDEQVEKTAQTEEELIEILNDLPDRIDTLKKVQNFLLRQVFNEDDSLVEGATPEQLEAVKWAGDLLLDALYMRDNPSHYR